MRSWHLNKYCFSFYPILTVRGVADQSANCSRSWPSDRKVSRAKCSNRSSNSEATEHNRAEMSSAGYWRPRYAVSSQVRRRHHMQTLVDHHRQLVYDTPSVRSHSRRLLKGLMTWVTSEFLVCTTWLIIAGVALTGLETSNFKKCKSTFYIHMKFY